MLPLVITRPEPVAQASVERARALGLDVHQCPLFAARPLPWTVPDISPYDALLITSAQSVRLGGAGLDALKSLPTYGVGAASADAAKSAGFSVVGAGDTDGQTLLADMQAQGVRSILWLCGRDHSPLRGGDLRLDMLPCYAVDSAEPPALWDQIIAHPAVLMAHSTRAAQHIAKRISEQRSHLILLAISDKVAAAAGEGWRNTIVAAEPTDAAMLAVAVDLCHKQPH